MPDGRCLGRAAFSTGSAEIHDDHAAVRVVLFGLRGPPPSRVAIERKLEARLNFLSPLALLLLALPNLLDDERRKHQVLPLHSRRAQACLMSFCATVDTAVTLVTSALRCRQRERERVILAEVAVECP
jgi:hypothetical protein